MQARYFIFILFILFFTSNMKDKNFNDNCILKRKLSLTD